MKKIDRTNLINPINLRKFSRLCTNCRNGFLRAKPNISYIYDPIPMISEDETDDEQDYRKAFYQKVSCDNCSDETLIAGFVQYTYESREIKLDGDIDYWQGLVSTNVIRYIEPAIDLMDLSYVEDAHAQKKGLDKDWVNEEIVPADIVKINKFTDCLRASFGLYWFDASACANKIRTSVEILKHAMGVSQLEKRPSFKEINELLESLLDIGNNGSHTTGKDITQADLLDAYDVLNSILYEYYGEHEKYKREIVSTSGRIRDKYRDNRKKK